MVQTKGVKKKTKSKYLTVNWYSTTAQEWNLEKKLKTLLEFQYKLRKLRTY